MNGIYLLKYIYKYIKYKINNRIKYDRKKYVKINHKNIYNYLNKSNIKYINDKFFVYRMDLIYIIKQSLHCCWLIKDKNVLIINFKNNISLAYTYLIININNLDDIKIYNHDNISTITYKCLLNDTRIQYYFDNEFICNITYYKKNVYKNRKLIPKKNSLNNKYYIMLKKGKILKMYEKNMHYGNLLYYKNYNIYIKFYVFSDVWFYNALFGPIRKIKLLFI